MENIEQLSQKQAKRRLQIAEEMQALMGDMLITNSDKINKLSNKITGKKFKEKPNKKYSMDQLDDYIAVYSQNYACLNAAANHMQSELQKVLKLKREKKRP